MNLNFTDKVTIDEGIMTKSTKNPKFISTAEEYFSKKVPLVDVMNSIKEVKEYIPTVKRLE